jgi:hypothetical protein
VETPFGQISDATLRTGVGKYAIQCMLLLVSGVMMKGYYFIGLFIAAIVVSMYYQWPLVRFITWRKPWFKHYFYGHLIISVVAGILIGDNSPGWVVMWGMANLLFAYAFMASFSDDIEELMQGHVDFSDTSSASVGRKSVAPSDE